MTLLWYDGYETYNNKADYDVVKSENVELCLNGSDTNVTYGDAYGRRSSRGLKISNSGYSHKFQLNSGVTPDEIVLGFAIKKVGTNNPTVNTSEALLKFQDFSGGSTHLTVLLNAGYNFNVYRDTTLLGTSSGKTVSDGVYHFFEIKAKIANSPNGYVQIWLDNTQILNLTGQDTLTGTNAYIRQCVLRAICSDIITYFDDLYLLDTNGAAPCNDRLGDIRIDPLRPNGAGSHTDFTPSAGSNDENVDEAGGPDDDTTYNDGSDVGNQDSYAMEDLEALGATIFGIKSQVTCKKTDAGARGYKILTRFNGSDFLSDEINPATDYETRAKIYQINPDDSAAFEEADINSMEIGVEITT